MDDYGRPFTYCSKEQVIYAHPRLTKVVTKLETNEVTQQEFGYDIYNNQTEVKEYDYGQGQPGALLRRTVTEYLTINPVNGVDYVGSSSGVHLRSLPLNKYVYAGTSTIPFAKTGFEYDNYTSDPGSGDRHAALVPRDDIYGLCTAFDSAGSCSNPSPALYTTRGNVTGTTGYLLAANDGSVTGSITGNQQYDVAGNVVKAVDALGHPVFFDFADRFGSPDAEARNNTAPPELVNPGNKVSYAFATKVTNALGHTAYTQYDYYTGQAVNTEDANGTVSSVAYGDLLDRPTKAERAVNVPSLHSQTTFLYDDANRKVTTTSDLNSLDDNLLKGEALYDGLGRTTESRRYETSSQYVSTLTQYDALGRASRVSNPYRPALGDTPVWTTSAYDSLGRVSSMTTPDGAKVYSLYDGVRTMVTDQAGKQRISKTDALGRLSDVWEVTAADSATESVSFPVPQGFPYAAPVVGYHTSYNYDVMGNLRKVDQVGQQRHFAYDSLSRLIRARNPEQDAIPGLALPANMLQSPTDNNAWSLSYEYDENGSLKKRTDARGRATNYDYDALGRATKRTYSDSTSDVNYYYDSQTLPPGAPDFMRGKSVGQLMAVTYGGVSSATGSYVGGFDELGRAHYSSQVTIAPNAIGQPVAQTYALEYDYYLDGRIKTERYPSGRIVETQYDAVGRVAGVMNQATSLYYAGGDPSVANNANVIAYAASGAVKTMRLGNGLWEHTSYNTRFQPTQIDLGTPSNNSSVLQLDYSYGTSDNNGNVRSQTITAPASGNNPAFTATQTYSYDALNRLGAAWELHGTQETWRQSYSYDRYGNRRFDEEHTTKLNSAGATVQAVDATNRAMMNPAISGTTNRITEAGYRFDEAGNLLCDAQHQCSGNGGSTSSPDTTNGDVSITLTPYFDYDGENHMTRAGGGAAQAGGSDYTYDGGGQRVKKVVGSQVTVAVYDAGGKLVAEYSNQVNNGGTNYVAQDSLGSTRVVTDKDGRVVSRHDYLPFGEEIDIGTGGRTTTQGYSEVDSVRQKFTSKERDSEIGLDYFGARHYSYVQGRFGSVDPMAGSAMTSNPQTFNRYAYTYNNPLCYIDIDGKYPITLWVRSFAPFSWFGPGNFWLGNGDSRKFSTSARDSFKIAAYTNYETATGTSMTYPKGSESFALYDPLAVPPIYANAYSEASIAAFNDTSSSRDSLPNLNSKVSYRLFGNNDAFVPGIDGAPTPDIDVKTSLRIGVSAAKNGLIKLSIKGNIYGDKFPSAEAFVTDNNGKSVFLGTFATPYGPTEGPLKVLPGDGQDLMINVNVTILTTQGGNFLGVLQNGKKVSIEEWNEQFRKRPTK